MGFEGEQHDGANAVSDQGFIPFRVALPDHFHILGALGDQAVAAGDGALPGFRQVIEAVVDDLGHGLLLHVLGHILAQYRAGAGDGLHQEDAALLCPAENADIPDDIGHGHFEIRGAPQLDRRFEDRGRGLRRDVGEP